MAEVNTTAPRRGVASARGTTRLKFTHTDADSATGLFRAHLENVDVTTIKIAENSQGMPSFNGLEIPRLRFNFASNEQVAAKRKYITLSFNAVESNRDTIPGGKDAWKVDQVFDWIKHILKVYACNGKELEDVFDANTLSALNLDYEDFDAEGLYVPVEPEKVIASWKTLFDNVSNILNRGNKETPYYLVDGKPIDVWIKLLRCTKSSKKGWVNVNNGDLSFPTFIGEGCIEKYVPNSRPSIHLDIVKESIIPRVKDEPKTPTQLGAPAMGMGIAAMGGVMGEPTGYDGGAMGIGQSPFTTPEDFPADF